MSDHTYRCARPGCGGTMRPAPEYAKPDEVAYRCDVDECARLEVYGRTIRQGQNERTASPTVKVPHTGRPEVDELL